MAAELLRPERARSGLEKHAAMNPTTLRGVAYWGLAIVILFTGLGAVAANADEKEAPAPVAEPAR